MQLPLSPFALLSLAFLAAPAPAWCASEVRESVDLLPKGNLRFHSTPLLGSTEGELNCDEVYFPGDGVRLLVQAELGAGAERRAELRALSKVVVERALLESDGQLSALFDQGFVFGFEIDWFFPTGGAAPANHLGVVCELWGEDLDTGAAVQRALVYGYGLEQYTARLAQLEIQTGHVLSTYLVWSGPLACSAGSNNQKLNVKGESNVFCGELVSQGMVTLKGDGVEALGGVTTGLKVKLKQGAEVGTVEHVDGVVPVVPKLDVDTARALAMAAGTYSEASLTMGGKEPSPDGLYFAEGDVVVECEGTVRTWTLVSAQGRIVLEGDSNSITAHTGGVACLSYSDSVRMEGDDNTIVGALHAVGDSLEISGDGNLLHGALSGVGIDVTGKGNLCTDGTHPIAID